MRRIWLLAILCAGCEDASAPVQFGPAPLEQPALSMGAKGSETLHLTRMLGTATFSLSTGHAADANETKEWPLSNWKSNAMTDTALWTHDLPFNMDQRTYAEQPEGLDLRVNGKTALYRSGLVNSPSDSTKNGNGLEWEIRAGRIFVVASANTKLRSAALLDSATNATLARRDFGLANLTAAEFSAITVEKGLQTRRSILLPAPSSAAFSVTVPREARLTFGIGIDSIAHDSAAAEATFEVTVDGEIVFQENASSTADWSDHSVDLSAYGGQSVQLGLQTRAIGANHHAFSAFAVPKIVGAAAAGGPSRIVVIGLDTLRKDHVGVHGYDRPVSPSMDKIAGQSIVFEEAWTPAPRTRPSFRSATTGRWPLNAVGAPTLGEVFAAEGWSTAGFVANVQLAPRLGFADGFDVWSYDNMADGDKQVDRTLDWLQANSQQDAFVFLHLMDPHIFYEAPKPFLDRYAGAFDNEGLSDRYNRWDINKRMETDRLSSEQQRWIEARYDGEIAFMDRQLARLVQTIDGLPGETLIVFHTDHGEEFWEHGAFEHNHSLYNELVAAILWVRPPRGWGGGPHRISAPVSLVDIAPTLTSLAGIDTKSVPFDGVDLSPFLSADKASLAPALATDLEARPLPLGHMMFNREQWGVIHADTKYILHTASGEEELYDLNADPSESANRAPEVDTTGMQGLLSQATGWPVLAGWRLQFTKLPHPTTITFKQPIGRAFILDPEVDRLRRANLEWGEVPPLQASDVATITTNEDRTEITILPGTNPSGILFIEGPGEDDRAEATCTLGGSNLRPRGRSSLCSRRATLSAGPLLFPTDDAGTQRDAPEEQTVEALRSLGYLD